MAVIEEALRTIVRSPSPQPAGGRVYFQRAPQQVEFPFIVYCREGTERLYGPSADFNYARATFKFEVFAVTAAECKTITNTLRNLLHRYSGTVNGVVIQQCAIKEERDDYEPRADCYVSMQTFLVGHIEA